MKTIESIDYATVIGEEQFMIEVKFFMFCFFFSFIVYCLLRSKLVLLLQMKSNNFEYLKKNFFSFSNFHPLFDSVNKEISS